MAQDKKKPGPEPDRLRLDEQDWEEAVKRGLKKKRPKDGWPDEQKGEKSPKKGG